MANPVVKIISWCLAFDSRSPARALAARLPCQDHVYITTHESFCFHNNKFDEMPRKLNFIENSGMFKKYLHTNEFDEMTCKLDCIENLRPF